MKKVLTVLAIYLVIGIVISLGLLFFAENYIVALNQTSTFDSKEQKNEDMRDVLSVANKVTVPDDEYNVQYSHDNKYYTYLKDSKIYINSIEDGTNVTTIEDTETDGICFYELLYDKNMIIYFTEDKGSASSTIRLKTYNIDTEKTGIYNKFVIYNFSKIKQMHMSPVINIIYINVEVKSKTATSNTIYSINLFNSMGIVKSGVQIEDFRMLQYTDNVYYKYANGNIYYNSSLLSIFGEKVDMIGLDSNDNMYFYGKESKNKVYKVKGTRLLKTIKLSDSDVIKTYSNNENVYVVYPTYVICVSGDNPYFRVSRMTKYVDFVAVKGNKIYLKTANNILTLSDLIGE